MTGRTLAILALFTALCTLAAIATTPPSRGRDVLAGPETFMLGLDVPGIRLVEVHADGRSARAELDGEWTVTLPDAHGGEHTWPADPDAVRAALRALATTPFEARDPPREDRGEPFATLRLHSMQGDSLTLDATGPALGGLIPLHVRAPGVDRAAAVPASRLRPISVSDIGSFARPAIVGGQGVIDRVRVDVMGETVLELERRAGVWGLPGSRARLDQQAVRALVESIASIRAAGIVVPLDGSALGVPSITIEVRASLARSAGEPARSITTTFEIGEQATIEGGVYALASRSGEHEHRLMVTLSPARFPELPASFEPLLDPSPLPWPGGEAGSITVELGGRVAHSGRGLSGWSADSGPADSRSIRLLLDALGGVSPVSAHTRSSEPAFAVLSLEPVGSGPGVRLEVFTENGACRVTDGWSGWRLDDADGSIRAAIERLAGAMNKDEP